MSGGDHQSMKKSKLTESSKPEDDVDRISNLPDHILNLILSSLPTTEDTIRTSILSKQWKYLWTSVPSVDVDCFRGIKEFSKKEFKEFVYWVLLNKSQYLESFCLSCSNYYGMSTIGTWIHAAVELKVKQLELMFSPREKECELPHCLLTCDSLKVLRLFLFRLPLSLPYFEQTTLFPALRVLELNGVELLDDESVVDTFFKSCHLLEELILVDCLICKLDYLSLSCPKLKSLITDNRKLLEYEYPDESDDDDDDDVADDDDDGDDDDKIYRMYNKQGLCGGLELHCPKLVYWEYGGHIAFQFFFDTQSLKKAVIYPEDMTQGGYLGATIWELFAGVSDVESLSINHYFVLCVNVYGKYPESLPNLKTLELRTMIDAVTMNILINILKRCPILESLHLIIEEGISPQQFQNLVGELNEVEKREILTRHLKRVEFLEFNREKQILGVARFLLEHGNALEEMVFSWCDEDKYNERSMESINEVSKFYKVSSSVKLITLLKDP